MRPILLCYTNFYFHIFSCWMLQSILCNNDEFTEIAPVLVTCRSNASLLHTRTNKFTEDTCISLWKNNTQEDDEKSHSTGKNKNSVFWPT